MAYGDPPTRSTMTYYGWCTVHGDFHSGRPRCPSCPAEPEGDPVASTWPQPPPVCTGSGHPPTDTPRALAGLCGICGREVGVDQLGRCVTHPYQLLAEGASMSEPPAVTR